MSSAASAIAMVAVRLNVGGDVPVREQPTRVSFARDVVTREYINDNDEDVLFEQSHF